MVATGSLTIAPQTLALGLPVWTLSLNRRADKGDQVILLLWEELPISSS